MIQELFLLHLLIYWVSVLGCTTYHGQWSHWQTTPVRRAIVQVLVNQFVVTPLFALFFVYYPPTLHWVHAPWQLAAMAVLTDAWFYTAHRWFHHPILYKHVHAWHHQFNTPIAAAALYAHPVEHFAVNLFSVLAPLFVVRASYPLLVCWTVFLSWNVVWTHSITDGRHTLHHTYRNCNYGVGFYWMDKCLGTWRDVAKE